MNPIDGMTALKSELAILRHAPRAEVLACIRPWLALQRHNIRQRFLAGGDVLALLSAHTRAMDTLLAALLDYCQKDSALPLAVAAVGGYGRGELFPYSDVDLLFLHDGSRAQETERVAKDILYLLWDANLTVGQTHGSIEEMRALAKQDMTVRTNLLDIRFIGGNRDIFTAFTERFEQDIRLSSVMEFVDAKLAEREAEHQRLGDSRYMLEPNVKEGKGGLRDLHTLWWLARYAYLVRDVRELITMGLLTREEYRLFERARQFLSAVRAHLHYLADHAEERLVFDRQHALAVAMGYAHADPNQAVTRFMRRYFAAVRMVGTATRIFCALLEEEKKRKPKSRLGWLPRVSWKLGAFRLDGERLNVRQEKLFDRQPIMMLELFRTAQAHGLDIHPRALQLVARNLKRIGRRQQQDARANTIFFDILLSGKTAEATLRKMSDSGVLGRFIPEFGRVVGQTQFNRYHIYTVDEHTLVAIGVLHALENGTLKDELPLASRVIQSIKMRRVLYAAMLCHDIAKGKGGDHSEAGEKTARRLTERFRFADDERDMVAWLVRRHLLFSATAFKRDIDDPKTVQDFVATVQSTERLKLLLLLTVADMRAVGPSIWNAWKASLLRELFARSEEAIGSGSVRLKQPQLSQLRDALEKQLPGWKREEIDHYLDQEPTGFLAGFEAGRHATLARMLKQAETMELSLLIDTQHDYEHLTTEITVCTPDSKGLFSKLAGAMSLAGANIIGARIFTLKSGMAVDVFQVQDAAGDVFDRPDRLAKMSVYIEQALSGELDLEQAFAERLAIKSAARRAPPAAGQVFIENDASHIHTVIEVTGPDRMGLLYRVTQAIAELGLSIATAHISTYGMQVADVFYVKDAFGMKIMHADRIKDVREKLLSVLNSPSLSPA